ncbi:2-oxoglutaramate amidase [compost metagenome]
MAGEEKIYASGTEKLIVEYKGWKICPLVCYDLRFPVFSRNVEAYDVLLYVANWPQQRIQAWDILLKARAVENMSYVIGIHRIGLDGNNHAYSGHSQVVDFLGNYLLEPQISEEICIVDLDKNKMLKARQKLGFLKDRDSFEFL